MAPATRNQQGKDHTSVTEVSCSFPENPMRQRIEPEELEQPELRVRFPSRRVREAADPPRTPTAPAKRQPRKAGDLGPAEGTASNEEMLSKLFTAILELKEDNMRLENAAKTREEAQEKTNTALTNLVRATYLELQVMKNKLLDTEHKVEEWIKATDKKVEDWMKSTDRRVEDWINAITSGSASQAGAHTSYANVARNGRNSSIGQQSPHVGSVISATASRSTFSVSSGSECSVVIDLHNLHESVQIDTTEIISVRSKLEAAFKAHDITSMVKIRSFGQRGDRKTFRIGVSEEDEKKLRNHDDWLKSHLRGATLTRPAWYPVKLDFVDKRYANKSGSEELRSDICGDFSKENGVKAHKMNWLGTRREGKVYGSVVVMLDKKEEVEKILSAEEITIGGLTVFAKEFEAKPTPLRCFSCHGYGHRASRCSRGQRCSACGEQGHADCETVNPKCVNCGGNHKASFPRCTTFLNECAKLAARQ